MRSKEMTHSAFRAFRLLVLPLAAVAALIGCDLGGDSNPLVGTWKGTVAQATFSEDITYQFRSDLTMSMVGVYTSIPPADESTATGFGSYTVNTSAKTATFALTVIYTIVSGTGPSGSFDASATDQYSISGSTLTLTDPTYGVIVLTKQ
jgi:hypothetical protein